MTIWKKSKNKAADSHRKLNKALCNIRKALCRNGKALCRKNKSAPSKIKALQG